MAVPTKWLNLASANLTVSLGCLKLFLYQYTWIIFSAILKLKTVKVAMAHERDGTAWDSEVGWYS